MNSQDEANRRRREAAVNGLNSAVEYDLIL